MGRIVSSLPTECEVIRRSNMSMTGLFDPFVACSSVLHHPSHTGYLGPLSPLESNFDALEIVEMCLVPKLSPKEKSS